MAESLSGLPRLRELGVGSLTFVDGRYDLDREIASELGAAVAALPPSLRLLKVREVGACAEGAALVVPPGRAQRLEVRCDGLGRELRSEGRLRTGRATVEDVRAFMQWLGPELGARVKTLILGGWVGWGIYIL
jgi:hypothetical protein